MVAREIAKDKLLQSQIKRGPASSRLGCANFAPRSAAAQASLLLRAPAGRLDPNGYVHFRAALSKGRPDCPRSPALNPKPPTPNPKPSSLNPLEKPESALTEALEDPLKDPFKEPLK